ncbi:toprim domain-containing protein [Shinella zoogloeoides]|uniref:toprim domain-containing protein n=1 Tax=Shinella zoogloeoides TaxID=352475 RepID=UPI0028ACCC39|nr:toprim domain-containing protein [Shinella zoogloeoides]
MTEDSSFVRKEPCPQCGSRDNLGRYSDGHGHCFGCGYHEPGDGSAPSQSKIKGTKMQDPIVGEFRELKARGITEETCRKFGYIVGQNKHGKLVQAAPYYDEDRNLVGQKVRDADKNFSFVGSMKTATLFGQHLWPAGGRRVVITEGEIDAMSVSQVQGNKWPVVSIPNGAQGAKKSLAKHLEWLNSFQEVVLMFDMDEPGREAMAACVELFPAGKAKTAELPRKDANEMLKAGEGDQIVQAIWNAKAYRPDGIVTLGDIKDAVLKPVEMGLPWWSETLTKLTYGRRFGELYAFGAGTGIGKTDWLTQQIVFDITKLNEPVGLFFLEQQPEETGRRVAGKLAGRRFHVPEAGWSVSELVEAIDTLEAGGKLFLYDSFGSTDWERIRETMRYLRHSEGVRIFYLDHLTALAAAEEDERKALEVIMAEVGGLVKELDCIIHIVSHLATPEGKPHEEGGRVMIRHFKGSRAIGFWCHYMFGLERDQQHEDPAMRSITTFRVLKDRYTGQATGQVIYLGYDVDEGRLFETEMPEEKPHGFKDETLNDDPPF